MDIAEANLIALQKAFEHVDNSKPEDFWDWNEIALVIAYRLYDLGYVVLKNVQNPSLGLAAQNWRDASDLTLNGSDSDNLE